MHIFDTLDAALRFAFILDEYPGDIASPAAMVRAGLHEAGIDRHAINLNKVKHEDVRAEAGRIIQLVREGELLQYQRAAIIVHYSRNRGECRTAVTKLAPYFYPGLRHIVDDTKVIDKLVTRHYTAARERHESWTLPSIADQYTIAIRKVMTAAEYIGNLAGKLDETAMESARRLLEGEATHV